MAVESALCAVIAGWEIVTRIVIGPKQAQPMARAITERWDMLRVSWYCRMRSSRVLVGPFPM